MACTCCGDKLNSGMIHKIDPQSNEEYKSCPHCSDANGIQHVFHPYPSSFGNTTARKTFHNPDGDQSYCVECRSLKSGVPSRVHQNGRICSSLI
jgi:hypothetical protein